MPPTGQPERPYHHGRLSDALIDAGLELTRTGGPAALGLREVTRRVGVSPNAAYRHFADRRSLLDAVVDRVRHRMVDTMAERLAVTGAAPGDPGADPAGRAVSELRAVGLGYIEFALTEPGWFDVAFAGSVFEPDGGLEPDVGTGIRPGLGRPVAVSRTLGVPAPFAALVRALDSLVEAGLLAGAARDGAEWPCWSAVHGFAVLAVHGPLAAAPLADRRLLAVRTVDTVVEGLLKSSPSATARP